MSKNKEPAFTLFECIIALLVTGIVIAIVSMTLPTAQRATRRHLSNPLDFELCLAELEGDDHKFRLLQVNEHSCELLDTKTKKHFNLLGRGRVYLTAAGGYMELLDDIQPGTLICRQLDHSRVAISVERSNGITQCAVVRFRPQKDDNNEKAQRTKKVRDVASIRPATGNNYINDINRTNSG